MSQRLVAALGAAWLTLATACSGCGSPLTSGPPPEPAKGTVMHTHTDHNNTACEVQCGVGHVASAFDVHAERHVLPTDESADLCICEAPHFK